MSRGQGQSFIHLNAFSKMPTNKFLPRGSGDSTNSLDSPDSPGTADWAAVTRSQAAGSRSRRCKRERKRVCERDAFTFCIH